MSSLELSPEQRGENLSSPERLKERYPLISLIGVVGVGKTEVLLRLPEFFPDFYIIQEEVDNPFLEDSYKDPERFSFPSQIVFAQAKYDQLLKIAIPRLVISPVVFEPDFPQDAIYAKRRLRGKELQWYQDFYQGLRSAIPIKPDIIIHLTASLENIKERIQLRAERAPKEEKPFRMAELSAPDEYWLGLMKELNSWVKENQENHIIIAQNTNNINYVNSRVDKIRFMRDLADDLQTAVFNLMEKTVPDGTKILLPDSLKPRPLFDPRAGNLSKIMR